MRVTSAAPARRSLIPPARFPFAVALLGAAALLLHASASLRVFEAQSAAPLIEQLTRSPAFVVTGRPVILAGVGTPWASAVEVSMMCSGAVLSVPVLVVAAVIALSRHVPPARLLIAILVCVTAIWVTNTARIVVIAFFMQRFGPSIGYVLAYESLGMLVSFAGVGVALILFVWLTVGDSVRTPS